MQNPQMLNIQQPDHRGFINKKCLPYKIYHCTHINADRDYVYTTEVLHDVINNKYMTSSTTKVNYKRDLCLIAVDPSVIIAQEPNSHISRLLLGIKQVLINRLHALCVVSV